MSTRYCLILLVALALWLGGRGISAADAPPASPATAATTRSAKTHPIPETMEQALAWLSSVQWSQRDAATTYLLRLPATARTDIESALRKASDAEAAARLRRIAVHLLLKGDTPLNGPAAVLGIALSLEPIRLGPHADDTRMSVTVVELQPGFPAAETLQPGDRLIAIDSVPFTDDTTLESFRRQINTMTAGRVLHLTIVRGLEQMNVEVKLAGIPEEGMSAIAEYVLQRNKKAADYLARLASSDGIADYTRPIVIPDSSPLEVDPGFQRW